MPFETSHSRLYFAFVAICGAAGYIAFGAYGLLAGAVIGVILALVFAVLRLRNS